MSVRMINTLMLCPIAECQNNMNIQHYQYSMSETQGFLNGKAGGKYNK